MEWRKAIGKCEKYQSTEIGGKCERNGGIEMPSGVGNRERKKGRDHEKEHDV
jgi:hypothetical protein